MENKKSISTRYRQTPLNTPVIHITGEILASLVSFSFWFRWQLSRPFQTRILPKWIPRITLYGFEGLTYLTFGEALLSIPLIFLSVAAYYYCFIEPDVDASGNVSSYFIIYGFMLANKSSSIFSLLLGIPFERLIVYHKITAVMALVIGIFHTVIAFDIGREHVSPAEFAFHTVTNTLGTLITICLTGFVATSLFPFFRRRFYDAWLFTHIGFIVLTALPWACHSINMVWLPLFWWALDIFVRYVLMARGYYRVEAATLRLLRPNVVEIRFRKPRAFHYNPGQFVRICIPQVTSYQFHPFSLSSAPHEEYVTLHVRGLGNWTKKIVHLATPADETVAAGTPPTPQVDLMLEGPYGSLSMDLDNPRYGMVLCVSGGIGVTHCRSVARSLVHDHTRNERSSLEQLRFIWAVRHYDLVEDLPPFEDQTISAQPDLENGGYQVSVQGSLLSEKRVHEGSSSSSQGSDDDANATAPLSPSRIFQTEVYVTSSKNKKQQLQQKVGDHEDNDNKESSDTSCTTNTNTTTNNNNCTNVSQNSIEHDNQQVVMRDGRPNLDRIVEEMKAEALQKGITHIAAFGCGPKPLIDALQEACRKHSKGVLEHQGVTFDLHLETFEF